MAMAPGESFEASFRNAMAAVCTPVAVITAMDGDRAHGTTVSAFASLSMTPPSLLVSLDQGSDLLSLVRRTGVFGVNVLGRDQSELASGFARKGPEKFSGVAWSLSDGVPRLDGAPGWFACAVAQTIEAADHVVVIGEVRSVDSDGSAPLTYHARTFGTHQVSS